MTLTLTLPTSIIPSEKTPKSSSPIIISPRYYQFGDDGFFNITSVQYGTPVFLSFPHFLHAPATYVDAIDGLTEPRAKYHSYDFGIEPTLGKTLYGSGKQQINIKIGPVCLNSTVTGMPNITYVRTEAQQRERERRESFGNRL